MMPHSDALIAEAARFAERLGAPLTLIHTASTRAEKATYLDELASRLAIPHEAHLIETPTNSSSPLMSRKLSGCPAKLASGRSDHRDGMKSGSFLKWIAPTRGRMKSSR
jgi:hypothetical protein